MVEHPSSPHELRLPLTHSGPLLTPCCVIARLDRAIHLVWLHRVLDPTIMSWDDTDSWYFSPRPKADSRVAPKHLSGSLCPPKRVNTMKFALQKRCVDQPRRETLKKDIDRTSKSQPKSPSTRQAADETASTSDTTYHPEDPDRMDDLQMERLLERQKARLAGKPPKRVNTSE